jgi:hypothetical protein
MENKLIYYMLWTLRSSAQEYKAKQPWTEPLKHKPKWMIPSFRLFSQVFGHNDAKVTNTDSNKEKKFITTNFKNKDKIKIQT